MKKYNKKKQLRVAMVGDYPVDENSIDGGVQAVTVYLANALAETGDIELHVIAFHQSIKQYRIENKNGFRLHLLPDQSFGIYTLYCINFFHLRSCLKKIKPDILHSQGASMSGYIALKTNFSALITFHGMIGEDGKYRSTFKEKFRFMLTSLLYERYCRNYAKYSILISPYVKEYYKNKLRGQTFYVPNPVKENFFNFCGTEKKGRILFAGKIIPRKGVMDLVKAVCLIKDRIKFKVILAGSLEDSIYVNKIKDYIVQNKMEEFIVFVGLLNEQQVLEEFRRCAMIVLPSYQETAPMVIQQAMAAAKPVIATSICGIPYQVDDGKTGLLFKPHDIRALSDNIFRLLNNYDLCMEMGRKAREKALTMYHAKEVARKTVEVYQKVKRD